MNSFFVELNHLDLMSVSGIDSERFLQGQLTCDVETVTNEQSALAAVCNNKGRVITNFRILSIQDNSQSTYFLEMQPAMLNHLKPVLDKYGVFYKSSLEDATTRFKRYGLVGQESKSLLSKLFPALPELLNQVVSFENKYLIKISDSPLRFELWLDVSKQREQSFSLLQELPMAKRAEWELLDIRTGIFQLEAKDTGLYTPQILNYDLAGLVSFSKGCYTGQEIVARMHYRGKAKKRLYGLTIVSNQEIQINDVIQYNHNTKLGEILKIQKSDERCYEALAILKIEVENIEASDNLSLKEHRDSQIKVIKPDYS